MRKYLIAIIAMVAMSTALIGCGNAPQEATPQETITAKVVEAETFKPEAEQQEEPEVQQEVKTVKKASKPHREVQQEVKAESLVADSIEYKNPEMEINDRNRQYDIDIENGDACEAREHYNPNGSHRTGTGCKLEDKHPERCESEEE